MDFPRRKRLGSHFSCDDDPAVMRSKKTCRESPEADLTKVGSCKKGRGRGLAAAGGRVVVTVPICSGSSLLSDSPGRGLKRKIGCVEMATRMGRKKRLEQEYVLGRDIGQGKFGSVRLCRSRSGREEFACKTLLKCGGEMVHREVEIMQHLSGHPGVVTLKAVYEDKESFHLVMELCSGGRLLNQMVEEGRFSEQRAAQVLKELVSAIKYCHDMGVIHRDIKPENILLSTSGKLKLADFGLAVRVTKGQKLSGIAGTPAYVAPEVLSGHYSEKVDIWGAGILLHALLIGILPFQGVSRGAVFEAVKTVELDFHSGIWESISELARDLIGRMLTRDVSMRMTADEVLRHPWILFYTERPSMGLQIKLRVRNNASIPQVADDLLSSENSSRKQEELEDGGFVNALAAAISRVRISEPKRTRICVPAIPIQQECSSNMKSNLCTAY